MRYLYAHVNPCFLFVLCWVCAPLSAQEPLPITETFQVNTYTDNTQATPDVSVGPDGQFVVVWFSFEYWENVEGGRTRAQRFAANCTPQGDEFLVHPESLDRQSDPRVSHAEDGAFLILWYEPPRVMVRRYASSGVPLAPPAQVNPAAEGTGSSGAGLSHGLDGVAVATWALDLDNGAGRDVWSQRIAADGTLLGSQVLVNSYTTGDQIDPEISHGPDGSYVIAWESDGQDGSSWGIYGQRFDSGGLPQGEEFQISTQTFGAQLSPHISHGPSGNFVVVWLDGPFSNRRLFGRLFSSDGQPADSEFEIAPDILNDKFQPSLTHDSHGDFLVVWADIQGFFESDPMGQRFSAQGLPIGEPFAISPFIPGEQTNPQPARGPAGSFAVVWHGETKGTSSFEIYGRTFCSDHDADQTCDGLLEDGFESGDLSRWSNSAP